MSRVRVVAAVVCLLSVPLAASAASSFVYVAAPVCQSAPSCAAEVLIYDATTAALVTRIALPIGLNPSSLAIAPDGTRLYVTSFAGDSGAGGAVSVIDTTLHTLLGTHIAQGGDATVSRDGSRLFIAGGNQVLVYDTAANTITTSIPTASGFLIDLAASPTSDRLYTVETAAPGFTTFVREYDSASGALLRSTLVSASLAGDLYVSSDGQRIYVTTQTNAANPSAGGAVDIFDAASLARTGGFQTGRFSLGTVDASARQRIYTWSATGIAVRDFGTAAEATFIAVASPISTTVTADETRAWVSTRVSSTIAASANSLAVVNLASDAVAATIPLNGAPTRLVTTPPTAGAGVCSYALDTKHSPFTVNGGTATITLNTACTWVASSDQPWARLSATGGTGNRAFTVTVDPNFQTPSNRSATLTIAGQLVTVTQAGFFAQPAFGVVDTPSDNVSGVTGQLIVSGWALDDVGVARVRIFRDPVAGEDPAAQVFIGDATFVDDVRPDVASFFSTFPNASRAGWGYNLLTNFLPGGGNGTFRLWMYAEDTEGHTTVLGTRTLTAANAAATLPFGNIDTPGQGQTVSGTIINFGWALTPQPKNIPVDGSTIDVVIDGVVVGHPMYGFARADIQALFPGYANTDTAVGAFVLDTTTLPNGVHTIAWIVRDNTGAAQGIGSRFFTVANQ